MKKQSGFSLIELIVAMAVLALIMGAMVHLFGSSVTSLQAGSKQEVVYEEARLLMNELKTTLRYADKDSIDPKKPITGTNEFSYKGNIWDRHMEIGKGENKEYKIKVEWKDVAKKQLQVTRENADGKKITVFPADVNNSVFEGQFPITAETITLNDGSSVIMYNIALPVQYLLNGQMKTQTLETKVVPSRDEEEESIEQELFKLYSSLVTIWHKLQNGENLTGAERLLLDDFKAYYKTTSDSLWQLGRNDRIRDYLLKTKYDGTWPSIQIDGETVYINPYGYDNNKDPITIDNIFVIGYADAGQTSGWNVSYVYDKTEKAWYRGKYKKTTPPSRESFSVTDKWSVVKEKINNLVYAGKWEKVTR